MLKFGEVDGCLKRIVDTFGVLLCLILSDSTVSDLIDHDTRRWDKQIFFQIFLPF